MKQEQEPTERPASQDGDAESQIRSEELYRMAAFRIRETANRIATLANSARDEGLRAELRIVYERLLDEERALLRMSDRT
jgi:hypothetical protein